VELAFKNAIHSARFLLGAQLTIIVRIATAAELTTLTVLTGCIITALEGAFRGKTTLALEKQFLAFTPAQFTYWPSILSHVFLSYSFLGSSA
jgi:ABC-type microcin C transport system permease subunit YejE